MPTTINPQINPETAKSLLSKRPGLLRKQKRIIKIELFYLPSYLVRLSVRVKQNSEIVSLCIDGVEGRFAFYHESSQSEGEPGDGSTSPFVLDEDNIRQLALSEYRRYLLRNNLMLRGRGHVEKIVDVKRVHYPFWLGFYRRRGKIDFDVLDAVGGEHQGAALRSVFMKALLAERPVEDEKHSPKQ